MAIDAKTLAASKKYTNETVIGGGAIKGKNCTIDSISPITGGNRVTFKWTLDDGTVQTGTMDVLDGQDGAQGAQGPQGIQGPAGADGLGINSVDIDTNNHLIITYDDGTTHDAGEIPGGGGTGEVTSVNGKKGVVKLYGTDIPVSDAVGAETIALSIDHLKASDLALKVAIHDLDLLVASKVDKEAGKGLSSNDFTTIDKTKLTNLEPIYLIGSGLNLDTNTGKLSATGMSIPIDTQLDPTSPNPVQNQAIAVPVQALQGSMAGKADKTEVNQIKLNVQQLQGSMANKADITDIPTLVSQLTNDAGFITKAVNDLVNYYLKSDVYTKAQVDTLIAAVSSLKIEVVQTLPTTDISTTTIYFVPKSSAFSRNVYDEYICLDATTTPATWEKIGDTEIDLTNYIQKSQTAGLIKNDGTVDTQIKLDVQQLQGSILSLTNDLTYKADKTELDEWIGPEYVDVDHKAAFDNLDDTQAYKLFGEDRIVRIEGQPRKDPGTNTGTVKITYTTDAPSTTECWLRMIKK